MLTKDRSQPQGKNREFTRVYQDGDLICQEGESSAEMFVIQAGGVQIFKDSSRGRVRLATLGKGDFFGEMSVLESLPRDASAMAVGETQVLVMTPGALLVRLRRDPTFAFELLRRLSGRVRTLNQRLMTALERQSEGPLKGEGPESLLYIPEESRVGEGT